MGILQQPALASPVGTIQSPSESAISGDVPPFCHNSNRQGLPQATGCIRSFIRTSRFRGLDQGRMGTLTGNDHLVQRKLAHTAEEV